MGIQDVAGHRQRSSNHHYQSGVCRWQGRLLLCARCPRRKAALEVHVGRASRKWPDHVRGKRKTIRLGRGGKWSVYLCPAIGELSSPPGRGWREERVNELESVPNACR